MIHKTIKKVLPIIVIVFCFCFSNCTTFAQKPDLSNYVAFPNMGNGDDDALYEIWYYEKSKVNDFNTGKCPAYVQQIIDIAGFLIETIELGSAIKSPTCVIVYRQYTIKGTSCYMSYDSTIKVNEDELEELTKKELYLLLEKCNK